jgi:hypothetical protein
MMLSYATFARDVWNVLENGFHTATFVKTVSTEK